MTMRMEETAVRVKYINKIWRMLDQYISAMQGLNLQTTRGFDVGYVNTTNDKSSAHLDL